jgi:2-oxoglutarate ferredoxin oxidoreductase subunit alpha
MVEDVKLAVGKDYPVEFYGRLGGVVPLPDEVLDVVERIHSELSNG